MAEDDSFGIAIMLPTLVFQADLSRRLIRDVVSELGSSMADDVWFDNDDQRIICAMANAMRSADDLLEGRISRESAVSEIACVFVYAFSIRHELALLDGCHGMVGALDDDGVSIMLCPSEADYQSATAQVRASVAGVGTAVGGDDFDDDFPTPAPTIH